MRKTYNISYHSLIFVFISGFICLSPTFDLAPGISAYNEKRIIQLGLLMLALCGVCFSRTWNSAVLHTWKTLPLISRWSLGYMVVAGALSSLLAPSTSYAYLELGLFCLLFFFCMFTATFFQAHRNTLLDILFIGIFTGAFFYEITFFTSYVGAMLQSNTLSPSVIFSGFATHRYFNQYQIWTIPLITMALFLYGGNLPGILKKLLYTISACWWVLLFASESRGAILALLISFTTTWLLFRKPARRLLLRQAYLASAGLVLYLILFVLIPGSAPATDIDSVLSSNGRYEMWMHAIGMIQAHPLLGAGPMHFAYEPNPGAYGHPHNSVLQIAAEWGLPTAALLLGLFLWGNIAWIKRFRAQADDNSQHDNQLRISLFHSLLAGSLYSLLSGVIVTPLSQLMLVITIGIMLGIYFNNPERPEIALSERIGFNAIAVSSLVLTIVLVMPQVQLRVEADPTHILDPARVKVFGPRFWQEGGIPHQ